MVSGETAYFGKPEHGVDALKATHELLTKTWSHEAELSTSPRHPLLGTASILVTHIEGGGFIAVPGACKISLIRTLSPGESTDTAVATFEAALKLDHLPEGITVRVNYPAGRDHPKGGVPAESRADTPAIQLLQHCIQDKLKTAGRIGGAPYWSEMSLLRNQLGCPTVYCAPSGISVAHTFEERIDTKEYLRAVRAFALFFVHFGTIETTTNIQH